MTRVRTSMVGSCIGSGRSPSPAPLTSEVRATGADGSVGPDQSLAFTTGDGPAAIDPPAPPTITAEAAIHADGHRESCGGLGGLCAATMAAQPFEITIRYSDTGGSLTTIVPPPDGPPFGVPLGLSGRSFCLQVRARDVLGRRSDPIERCTGRDLEVRRVDWPDLYPPPCQAGQVQGPFAPSCSINLPGRVRPGDGVLPVSGILVLLSGTRRRNRRSEAPPRDAART